jgi:hypothetical protein
MNKRKIVLNIVFVFVIGFFFIPASYAKTIKWLDGNWEGQKYQTNMDKSWRMKLSLNTKLNQLTVEYPELNCKGSFVIQKVKGKMVILTEKMNSGSCLSDGYIIITYASKDLITFTCLRDNETRLASYCTLERK